MGRTCYICKKAGQHKLPKAHEKRLLKELGFSEPNLPPKSAFFCREHFTKDSFKFVDFRTVWNYNPRVKELSNCNGTPGNLLEEVVILEESDDGSFTGSSVPPSVNKSLKNDSNEALGNASEEAGYTEFETVFIPSDVNKSLTSDRIGGFTAFKENHKSALARKLTSGWNVDFYEIPIPHCACIYFKEFSFNKGVFVNKNVVIDYKMRAKVYDGKSSVDISRYTTSSRTLVSWKSLDALLYDLEVE